MKKYIKLPDTDFLNECFCYDSNTGYLTWKNRPRNHFVLTKGWTQFNNKYPGKQAGTLGKDGAKLIKFKKRTYQATRIIWKIMTGKEPFGEVVIKNGVLSDLRWENLCLRNYSDEPQIVKKYEIEPDKIRINSDFMWGNEIIGWHLLKSHAEKIYENIS